MGFVTSPSQQAADRQSAKPAPKKQKLSASMVVRPEHIITSEAQQEAEALEQKGKK